LLPRVNKSNKVNLRGRGDVSGAGGVILDSDGQKLTKFSWGLGQSTNNSAEALEVYMGMRLITDRSPVRLVVIGDFDLIIKGLQRNIKNAHLTLATIFLHIRELEKIFEMVSYYHVLRSQNS
jgi:ribonuclease HI